ncbi:unnamed protein product, partial [Mesorhabditis belari]|uniref:Uncharacterized protein n=1 Tax=Mesorhabditis belari TaxID=2138241 RepID=A0AAF3EB10_9BILA
MAERGGALVNRLTSNPEQRMALQNALYNTAMFVMLGLVCAALAALYNMMYMFLTPMLWAVLVGTVMFPLKRRVTDITQGWLENLQDNDTPLSIAILVAPYKLLYNASEIVFNTSMSATGGMIASVYILLKILSYERTFVYVISWIGRVYQIFDSFIHFFGKPWIFPLVVLYFAIYATWIYFQDRKQINKKLARSLSLPIWIYGLSWISGWFGPFRVLFFGGSAAVLGALSAGLLRVDVEEHDSSTTTPTVAENLLNEAEEKIKDVIEPERPKRLPGTTEVNHQSLQSLDSALTGDAFIRIIAVLCALLWIVRHDTALVIIVVPFLFAILRRLGEVLGVFNFLSTTSSSFFETTYPTIKKVVDVTVAGPLRQFVKVLSQNKTRIC